MDDRQAQLISAKRKLKSYRARQSKANAMPSSPSSSGRSNPSSPLKQSTTSRAHAHRRSTSRSLSISLAAGQPFTASSHQRRASRRHSRTSSVLSVSLANTAPLNPSDIAQGDLPTGATQRHSRRDSSSLSFSFNLSTSHRMSVPTFTTAPNGRILPSPNSSPLLAQTQYPGASASATSAFAPSTPAARRASLAALPSFTASNGRSPAPESSGHTRRPSKHTRRTSVATRRESMEIMSGLQGFGFPSSPEPSATAAFLASSDLSRSTTMQSNASQATGFGYDDTRFSENNEEYERAAALNALEGRLSIPSDTIELPLTPDSISAPAHTSSKMEKRASWAGNTLEHFGGKGAQDLGMLVEEEEDEDEENSSSSQKRRSRDSDSNRAPAPAVQADTSMESTSSSTAKRARPASLIFPPSKLPFGQYTKFGQPTPSGYTGYVEPEVSPTSPVPPVQNAFQATAKRSAPRALSLASASSFTSPIASTDKSTRRLSGLKNLTLTSPEHQLSSVSAPASATSAGANGRKRFSLMGAVPKDGGLPSPDALKSFTLGSAGPRMRKTSGNSTASFSTLNSSLPPSAAGSTPARRERASLSYRQTSASPASANTSFSPSVFKRYSDISFASSSAGPFGFGDLVMEESVLEEDEDDSFDQSREESEKTEKTDLLTVDRPPLARSNSSSSTSDDPVILSMQVQALRSQVSNLQSKLSAADDVRKAEVSRLRDELAEVKESASESDMEREMLREDIDGWRTRCADLERTLQAERQRAEDERKEGMLLREKVRKLGDRLAASQATQADPTSHDQQLAAAQAKLISEMRDQIFSLAAALERERLKNAGRDSNHTSPLLHALEAQEDRSSRPPSAAAPSRSHDQSFGGSNASSAGYSTSSGSLRSTFGNITEDTSLADDDSMYGSKSPMSPAFATSFTSSGISIHPSNTPLRTVESHLALGALGTLAEEDEEEEEEGDAELVREVNMVNSSRSSSSLRDEDADQVPELVHDDLLAGLRNARNQSSSAGSSDTNDHMPLTPVKESTPTLLTQQQSKPSHERSDSFIKQWSFPKGHVRPESSGASLEIAEHERGDSFWAINHRESLPPLPVSTTILETPFSEMTFDEDYFSKAKSRPASILIHAQGPPPARSSTQARRLSAEIDSAPPSATSVASRLSWIWGGVGYKTASASTPVPAPVSAPAPVQSPARPLRPAQPQHAFTESVSPFESISISSGALAPPLPPKTAPKVPARRLLKLEPSNIGRLDFTSCCACDGARILRV